MNKKNSRLFTTMLLIDFLLVTISFLSILFIKYGDLDPRRYGISLPLTLVTWTLISLIYSDLYEYQHNSAKNIFKNHLLHACLFMGAFSFLILALNLKLHSRFILFGTIVPFVVLRYLGFFIIIKIFSNRKPG